MNRKVPRLLTDAAAKAFLEQDLSKLDFSQFHRADFFRERGREADVRAALAILDSIGTDEKPQPGDELEE
ncbi:MAG TPA: hypothetical protein VMU81_02640 [Acetobacteraceae bacterium]|jgi:hypothetical protein|nr:hypothetical protein [Acetobacteraceae bacterium]